MRRRQLSIDNAAAPRLRAASGICRSTGQTDGRTLDRYIDFAPHTTRASSTTEIYTLAVLQTAL